MDTDKILAYSAITGGTWIASLAINEWVGLFTIAILMCRLCVDAPKAVMSIIGWLKRKKTDNE